MTPPLRILRAEAQDLMRPKRHRTSREQERLENIITVATTLMVRYGRHGVTMGTLALAMDISRGALRHHFVCIDSLLGEILSTHLQKIVRALGEVPRDAVGRPQRLRAAYYAATREAFANLTPAHKLLVRERDRLPEDILEGLEETRRAIGYDLAADLFPAGTAPEGFTIELMDLLDRPWIDAARIEPMVAALQASAVPTRAAVVSPVISLAAPENACPMPALAPATPLPDTDDLAWLRPARMQAGPPDFSGHKFAGTIHLLPDSALQPPPRTRPARPPKEAVLF